MSACEQCGFRADDYTDRDREGTARALLPMLDGMLEPVDPADTTEEIDERVASVRATAGDATHDVDALHRAVHGLRVLSRLLHEAGLGAPSQQGVVVQLSTSGGGVPKTPVPSADVSRRGLVGDRQANRKHHGRPMQALCLWSADVIDALAAEGHPIAPGAAGENVTVGGIDWSTIRPGTRLLLGPVLCEVSGWAEPCRKNDQWFTGRSDRIDHELHPGWSRAYAWVLEPDTITTGDVVVVEP